MRILFLCETNRFQSKVAEMLFNKFNKNKKFFAKSAGLYYGGYYFNSKMLTTCKEMGIDIIGRPVKLNKEMWGAFDLIITTTQSVKLELTRDDLESGKELMTWEIEELNGHGEEDMKKVIRDIAGKVKELVEVI
ncbi:MAG: hypothetical protein AABW82_02480 [Nanoarchaeota archaeon]